MAIQKKSLLGAVSGKQEAADNDRGTKPSAPVKPATAKKLTVAKLATAKLSTAKLVALRKLS